MKISLYRHAKIKEYRGDILFTHDGLSGPEFWTYPDISEQKT